MQVKKFITHSKHAVELALKNDWYPGARYTNIRDIKTIYKDKKCFIDIDWKNYEFNKHLEIVVKIQPYLTIARDIETLKNLDKILKEAEILKKYSKFVAVVPKDPALSGKVDKLIPKYFLLAYSVPTKYGGTKIPVSYFDRPVHLLGGRPDIQRSLANNMNVFSFDCNRFTYDARFGDYFDGDIFRPHPKGGYHNCLLDSISNINDLWKSYRFNPEYLYKNCEVTYEDVS